MISFFPHLHWDGPRCENGPVPEQFLVDHFRQKSCVITESGRQAISLLLEHLQPRRPEEVCVLTTFDFPNVSSCVTCTIFNVCKPSRVVSDVTRAVFVIHEFGVVHPEIMRWRELCDQRGVPLIEDCAHTMDSARDGIRAGTVGDYVICSFPKVFPMAYGGALVCSSGILPTPRSPEVAVEGVRSEVGPHLARLTDYSQQRRRVFRAIQRRLRPLGLDPFIDLDDSISPWFFPVRTPRFSRYLQLARQVGVDCARWPGTDIVVLPCHQFLTDEDIEGIGRFVETAEKG